MEGCREAWLPTRVRRNPPRPTTLPNHPQYVHIQISTPKTTKLISLKRDHTLVSLIPQRQKVGEQNSREVSRTKTHVITGPRRSFNANWIAHTRKLLFLERTGRRGFGNAEVMGGAGGVLQWGAGFRPGVCEEEDLI